jgi:hypothetical protein
MDRTGLARALVTLAASIASFAIVFAIASACACGAQPAILAAILAIGFMRRPPPLRGAAIVAVPAAMIAIAVVATAIGLALRFNHVLGAAVFTGLLALSLFVRKYGDRARRAGELLALPLVTMLVVPPPVRGPHGPLVDLAVLACAGIVPVLATALLRRLAPAAPELPRAERRERAGLAPTTRMALQLTVALGAAFAIGFAFFPEHWAWVVLTAFLVCSGSLGREHAIYFGIMRFYGALAGTLAAALLAHVHVLEGPAEAVVIFIVLFFGIWLREKNYAFWAACVTIILALLAPATGAPELGLLEMRVVAIVAGALCAIAAVWFVSPIRTHDIVRLRLAELLAAIDDIVAHVHGSDGDLAAKRALVDHRLAELNRIAPTMDWHVRFFARNETAHHPAHWIVAVRAITQRARLLAPAATEGERPRIALRRAIGISRRAIAQHGKPDAPPDAVLVADALAGVHDALRNVTG